VGVGMLWWVNGGVKKKKTRKKEEIETKESFAYLRIEHIWGCQHELVTKEMKVQFFVCVHNSLPDITFIVVSSYLPNKFFLLCFSNSPLCASRMYLGLYHTE